MILSSPDPASDPFVASALLKLQRAAYAVEAQLLGDDRIPPLQEDDVALTAFRGRWVVAWQGVELLGAIAWTEHVEMLDIEKIMVRPDAHRLGLGTRLLAQALEASAGRQVHVATGRDNLPAVTLYRKHGFETVADEQVPPGIWITRLRRSA